MSDDLNRLADPLAATARRNIEIKARLNDFSQARNVASATATDRLGILEQIDTYFNCEHGRLKLREILGQASELIWYQRPNEAGPRESRFGLIEVEKPDEVKSDLRKLLGVWKVVKKTREVFLYHNVRIHLDKVDGLGSFLEFEAIVDDLNDDQLGHHRLDFLCNEFSLSASDFIAGSYSDMIGA
jgi:adenylate cyclase class 2